MEKIIEGQLQESHFTGSELDQEKPLESRQKQRSKSSLRMQYEAEAGLIRQKLGDLDEVRQKLGLSQRKICQLLMIDPSCWSRWVKDPGQVPPHIWRSFQWYFSLIEKHPEWHPQNSFLNSLNRVADRPQSSKKLSSLIEAQRNEIEQLNETIESMRKQGAITQQNVQRMNQLQVSWKFLVLINSLLVVFLIIYQWL